MFLLHWCLLPITLVLITALNIYLIISEFIRPNHELMDPRVRRDFIIQKLVAFLPFCITAVYCMVYQFTSRTQFTFNCFRDFYTFLGYPLTCLHFINLLLHSLGCALGVASNFIVFPVAFDKSTNESCLNIASITVLLNFVVLSMLFCFYDCLATFKPYLPISMFTLLFGGVLLDRLALIDRSSVSREDVQFIASLAIQICIVDLILIGLAYFAHIFAKKDAQRFEIYTAKPELASKIVRSGEKSGYKSLTNEREADSIEPDDGPQDNGVPLDNNDNENLPLRYVTIDNKCYDIVNHV